MPFAPRSRPLLRRALAIGALAAVALATPAAQAFERQWHAGGSLGYVALMGQNPTLHGFGGGIHLAYGITDAFNLMIDLNLSGHPGREGALPEMMMSATPLAPVPSVLLASGGAGIGYVFDVLQWVPYVGALAGAADVIHLGPACTPDADPCHALQLDLQVPFGLDYAISRSFAVGIAGRYQLLLGRAFHTEPPDAVAKGSASPFTVTHALGGYLRLEYVWGY